MKIPSQDRQIWQESAGTSYLELVSSETPVRKGCQPRLEMTGDRDLASNGESSFSVKKGQVPELDGVMVVQRDRGTQGYILRNS